MNTQEAKAILGIASDVDAISESELKLKYRRIASECHPDKGGNDDSFVRITESFNLLKKNIPYDNSVSVDRTVTGELLSDLGQGLPLTVNATICNDCHGNGYTSVYEIKEKTCNHCHGTGSKIDKCKNCSGLGYYRNPETLKNVGECEVCSGRGWFVRKKKSSNMYMFMRILTEDECCHCGGHGYIYGEDERILCHRVCDMCKGMGEIRIYNPVIPRGFLTSNN